MNLENIIKEVKPNVKSTSINTYIADITRILNLAGLSLNKDLKEIIKDNEDKIVSTINDNYKSNSSKRNKLNAFIILYKYYEMDKSYKKLSELRDSYNQNYLDNAKENKNKPADYVSTEDYNKLLQAYSAEFKSAIKANKFTIEVLNKMTDYIILLFYFHFILRSDLEKVIVEAPKDVSLQKKNHIVITTNVITLYINEYKTSDKHNTMKFELTNKNEVNNVKKYITFLKTHIKDETIYLLYGKGLKPLNSNSISQRFKNIFKTQLNKNFTITMNRKRHFTENPVIADYIKNKKSANKLANKAGTSLKMVEDIYKLN